MAKTAILLKATGLVIGTTTGSAELNKMVIEGAGVTDADVELVTAKNFQPTEHYKTFKEMSMTQEERDAAAQKAADAEKAKAEKEEAKKAREAAKAEKANKPKSERTRNTAPLEGEYHIVKSFPATPADHPKMPIWEAIANNTTVEAAKAACPEKNPPRKTNGVYTFNSEFRYFLNTGYVALGPRPEGDEAPAEGGEATEGAEEA